MDFDNYFKERLDPLRAEGRYRVFADLERRCVGISASPTITASVVK